MSNFLDDEIYICTKKGSSNCLALQLNTIKSSLDLTLIILSTALDSQWAGHSIVKAKQLWWRIVTQLQIILSSENIDKKFVPIFC